ncbi:MAG TPA: YggT family protein [Actinomycetota bacterium]|nr:YggT family protein [Actinomycetota bacterium]
MSTVVRVICIVLTIYWVILFARIIMSWFRPPISGIGRTLWDIVQDLTEPVLGLVRGLLPPVRMGAMGLDLSPIIVFVALGVIQAALGCAIGF